jgi:hypothetical protein
MNQYCAANGGFFVWKTRQEQAWEVQRMREESLKKAALTTRSSDFSVSPQIDTSWPKFKIS